MALDPRSLALFRIALGLLLLVQGLLLVPIYGYFYQHANHEGWYLIAMPLSAIGLFCGFKTRLSAGLGLILIASIQQATSQAENGGDVLLRLLLFGAIFLPLDEAWSLDRHFVLKRWVLPLTEEVANWAFTLQICFVYWFAALLKSDPLWCESGNALFYALSVEHFTTPIGLSLRQFPDFLRILTFATRALEFVGPLLLLIPYRRSVCRMAAVGLFLGFHLIGMTSLLKIGPFPWVCAAAWLPFIPGTFWDYCEIRWAKWRGTSHRKRGKGRKGPSSKSFMPPLVDYLGALLVLVSLGDVLAWNIASVYGENGERWMNSHDFFGTTIGLQQQWNMYAPAPSIVHGWLVVPASLADGSQVDLFTEKAVSWDKPANIADYMGTFRWRRYLSNLFDYNDPKELDRYANYLTQRWNHSHSPGQKVETVSIVFMKQVTLPNLTISSPEKEVLYFKEM